MFKIQVNVSGTIHNYLAVNRHEDDFLQFWPKIISDEFLETVTKDEFTVYKISEQDVYTLKANSEKTIDLDTPGEVRIKDEQGNIEHIITCSPLSGWPYDEDGKFLGNN